MPSSKLDAHEKRTLSEPISVLATNQIVLVLGSLRWKTLAFTSCLFLFQNTVERLAYIVALTVYRLRASLLFVRPSEPSVNAFEMYLHKQTFCTLEAS